MIVIGNSNNRFHSERERQRKGASKVPILILLTVNYVCNGEHQTVTYANMQKINLHTRIFQLHPKNNQYFRN